MRAIFQRHLTGQSPFGIFSNIWPTALNKQDRKALGGWYVAIHLGTARLTFVG